MRYRIMLVQKNSGLKYVYSVNISGYPEFKIWDKNLPEDWIYTFYDEDSAVKTAKASLTNNSTRLGRMAADIDDLKKYRMVIVKYHKQSSYYEEGWYDEVELTHTTVEAKV